MANRTFLRGEGFLSLLRRVEPVSFPALAFLLDHPEGLIAIDTGLGAHVTPPRRLRGFPPTPDTDPDHELGIQMRRQGLDPSAVRLVILTHLDWDHTGGLRHFPNADVIVHRPEWEFAQSRAGKARYRPSLWPDDWKPKVYDLEPEPYGTFPVSRTVTSAGDVRLVPIPGHSPGQIAVAWETEAITFLFAADHMLRADWFVEDLRGGRMVMMGPFGKRAARESSRRLEAFLRERDVVLVPSHDAEAPGRLAARVVTTL